MFNLNSKKVLITGGSRGIGAACVKYFCMAGASVAFTYNTNSAVAARLEKRFAKISKCKGYKVDINNEEEIKNTVQMVVKDFGRIDVLVNNAGIWKEAKISAKVEAVNEVETNNYKNELPEIYPNPVTSANSTISFSTAQQGLVEIKMYNVNAAISRVVYSGTLQAGSHEVSLPVSELSSGVWIVELSVGNFKQNRKVVILK